ncbi:hypothetical protein D3C76_1824480 [compost metagenome]
MVMLGDLFQLRRLWAVDTTRTGHQKTRNLICRRVLQQMASAIDNLGVALQRAELRPCRGIGCGVQHMREIAALR